MARDVGDRFPSVTEFAGALGQRPRAVSAAGGGLMSTRVTSSAGEESPSQEEARMCSASSRGRVPPKGSSRLVTPLVGTDHSGLPNDANEVVGAGSPVGHAKPRLSRAARLAWERQLGSPAVSWSGLLAPRVRKVGPPAGSISSLTTRIDAAPLRSSTTASPGIQADLVPDLVVEDHLKLSWIPAASPYRMRDGPALRT